MARRLGGAILACALALAPAASAQTTGGAATYAAAGGIGTLDPHVTASLAALEVIHHLYEPLVAMDESYNARPMLAAAVAVRADARRYRFTLRRNVTFHSGAPLTSADVLASFQRYAEVSNNAALLENVASYETPDAATFVVNLKAGNAVFLDMLKSPTYPLAILPADQKDQPAREADIVGTGPFTLDSWEKDSHLVLRRNESYAPDRSATGPDGLAGRKTAHLDTVRIDFVADPAARLAALLGGEADVANALPPEAIAKLDGREDIAVLRVFPSCQLMFVTHAGQGPTANVLVRQAIRAAVDVADILAAAGLPARRNASLTYPGSPYHTGESAALFYDRHDLDETRRLLRAAGYAGEKLVLQTNSTFSYMRDAVVVLATQLERAGMTTAVDVVDWMTNSANLRRGTGEWHVTATGFCTQPLLGPQQWRRQILGTPHLRDRAAIAAAFEQFAAAPGFAERQAAWQGIEHRLLDEAHMIKVADLGAVRGHAARLRGVAPYFFQRFWNTWIN
jgi:peptide/nickel transport system substrate-binding protein